MYHNIHCSTYLQQPGQWEQSRCPSTDEWIKKLWYMCTIEYYSAIKRSELESDLMDEPRACYTEQSKSKREKQVSYINTYR